MSDIEKPKRKYVKKSKMLLRSNNDYIDHSFWPSALAKSKLTNESMMQKYGVPRIPDDDRSVSFSVQEKEDLRVMGIGKRVVVEERPPMKRIPLDQ